MAVNDVMAQVLWTTNFLEAQDCKIKKVALPQDNQSTVKSEKNGQKSADPRSSPTDNLEANCMTKALQGSMFARFGGMIMNLPSVTKMND